MIYIITTHINATTTPNGELATKQQSWDKSEVAREFSISLKRQIAHNDKT